MKGRDVFWVIVYYMVVAVAVYLLSTERAPLKVQYYYYLTRITQRTAAFLGRVGLDAEFNYHQELERTR